eukprot:GHVS01090906.1.p1 GENE.GHVS01090906.1~~GHVS01090906.1.p1  ORF type:complete len:309 (+),score=36.11 GHVS01090906.1:833-1759(+)
MLLVGVAVNDIVWRFPCSFLFLIYFRSEKKFSLQQVLCLCTRSQGNGCRRFACWQLAPLFDLLKMAVVSKFVCLVAYCLIAVSAFLPSAANGEALRTSAVENAEKAPETLDMVRLTDAMVQLKEVLMKTAVLDKAGKGITTTTTTAITTTTTTTGTGSTTVAAINVSKCLGPITLNYGTVQASRSNVGKKVPMKKLVALNPHLFGLCNDVFTPQCLFGYIFPLGIVDGVDGQQAGSAVMIYVLTTRTWALYKSEFAQSPLSYSSSKDVGLESPHQATTFPWLTGPAAVDTQGQTVQGVTCGGKYKIVT